MASIDYQILEEGKLRLIIQGRLDAEVAGRLWPQAVRKLDEVRPELLVVDASGIEYCDGAGIGLLLEFRRRQQENNAQNIVHGLFLKIVIKQIYKSQFSLLQGKTKQLCLCSDPAHVNDAR